MYAVAGCLTMVGIFAMRWNVVIGGQLFSKSLLGYTTYDLHFGSREGLATAIILTYYPARHSVRTGEASAAMATK